MDKNIRIKTTPGGEDKYVKINLEQDFDFLEILSLKISQEDVYRRFYSDYGVVVGRVICNNGLGIPNAKISIFIPIDPNERDEIKSLYPYNNILDKNENGLRYNLLPKNNQNKCHVPVGSFPNKRDILDNDINLEIFNKYYKYTATTNSAGDFMLFGVPVGNHIMNVDVDLSDIGIFSQKPYDFIGEGNPQEQFKSTTQFKSSKNLNSLTQVKNQQTGVNVLPFWGENKENEVGITRIDIDLNYDIKPKAMFIGSMFGDDDKNSVNKNCQSRKKTGKVCDTVPNGGRLEMVRKTLDSQIENFNVDGGDLIDDNGVWAYQIPMNLDYMITDEFGKLIPTEEPNKGIPTSSNVRFKIDPNSSGGEDRLRTRANYLIPHNPKNLSEIDYEFGENTKDSSFTKLYWNKIYTVKNFIPRMQTNSNKNNRNFLGLKDVDDCVGNKTPIPFNRLDGDLNPLYVVICIIISLILLLLTFINQIISWQVRIRIPLPLGSIVVRFRPFCGLFNCIMIKCLDKIYRPGCKSSGGRCYRHSEGINDSCSVDGGCSALDCYQIALAEALNVYEFDFYNDWLNGTLYGPLIKYKYKKNGDDKFCDVDEDKGTYLMDTMSHDHFDDNGSVVFNVDDGIVKEYNGELYYAATTGNGSHKILATDIICLGTINKYDWQGLQSIHENFTPTTYKVPPLIYEGSDMTPMVDYGGVRGLLFDIDCLKISVTPTQSRNVKRLCEIGVGLDEDRSDEPGGYNNDGGITIKDIEGQFVRDSLIALNSNVSLVGNNGLNSHFDGSHYNNYRGRVNDILAQPENSFYFYFGTEPNKTAIEKMNKKYFVPCVLTKNKYYGEE